MLRAIMRDYLDSRPVMAELEAIKRAILFAEETGCSLHVDYVSTGCGAALVAAARERGVDVTCETRAHYLAMTEEDAEALGSVAMCAPSLRSRGELESLWERLFAGDVEFVISDHSPCPPDMKVGDDMFRAWGGIAGCQSLMNLVLDEGCRGRGLALEAAPKLLSGNVARLLSLPGKGRLEVGYDADLTLVDLECTSTPRKEDLLYWHKISLYPGRSFTGEIVRTIVRGNTVFREGEVVVEPAGRLLKPNRQNAKLASGKQA